MRDLGGALFFFFFFLLFLLQGGLEFTNSQIHALTPMSYHQSASQGSRAHLFIQFLIPMTSKQCLSKGLKAKN